MAFPGITLTGFTEDHAHKLHKATIEVLEKTGVDVYLEEAANLLKNAGANVDGTRVRIPSNLIEKALETAPDQIIIYNREGEQAMQLAEYQTYYGTGSDTLYTIDIETGERRLSVKEDIGRASRVANALQNIDFVMSMGVPSDVPPATSYLHEFEAMVNNTKKPMIFTAESGQDMGDIIKMASIVVGGSEKLESKPFIILYAEPTSPLTHSKEALEKLMLAAEKKVPVIYTPAVLLGACAPITMEGALLVANCELLSGLVMHQLKAAGAPIIYGGGIPTMDMHTGLCTYGSPELHTCGYGLASMGRFYRLPIFAAGGCTDSLVFDQQAGIEVGYNLLMESLSGANIIHDVGYMGSGTIASLESLVSCDEMIGMVKRTMRGFDFSPAKLAADVVNEIGPGGNFIGHQHTLKHLRTEMWHPTLFNRLNYTAWAELGKPTLYDKANARVKELLEKSQTQELDKEIKSQLSELISRKEEKPK